MFTGLYSFGCGRVERRVDSETCTGRLKTSWVRFRTRHDVVVRLRFGTDHLQCLGNFGVGCVRPAQGEVPARPDICLAWALST